MKIKANKILAVLCVIAMIMTMIVPMTLTAAAVADEYSYTFTAKQFTANDEAKDLGGVNWTFSGTGNGYWGYDATKGQQFGSSSNPYNSMTLTSESFSNVSKIVINTSGASKVAASFTVSVGGTNIGEATTLTATATEYTFTPNAPLSGAVAFNYTQTSSKAIYIKSIVVTYTEGGATDPDVPSCEHANKTTTTVDATCTEDGSTTVTCDDCGTTLSTEVIEATGHNYVEGVCDVCEAEEPETPALVTDVNDLRVGDKIVIVAKNSDLALSITQNNNNRAQVAITKDTTNNTVTINDSVQILTLEEGTKDGTFAFYTGSGYLYAASSNSNYLKTETTLSDNSSWTITIVETTGVATIKAQGTNTRNWLRYNSQNSIFSCYSSGQADVVIYKFPALECEHTNTVPTDAVDPTCTEVGYTPGTQCSDCGAYIGGHETIPATGHEYVDGVCACGEIEPDTALTIAQAIALGNTKTKDNYTVGKYYVTGVITSITNTQYGNMMISDGTNEILVYGTYDATGANRFDAMANKPAVGDTVTVYGVVGMYNDAQLKNAWITDHIPAVTEIAQMSVNAGADLSLLAHITLAYGEDIANYSVKFTSNGAEEIVAVFVEKDGKYVFALDKLAPQTMADLITIELLKDGEVVDTLADYSIKAYAETILQGEYSDELKILVTEMLSYGETAQKYLNYNMDNLATAGLDTLLVYGDANRADFVDEKSAVQNAEKIEGLSITALGVQFDCTNKIYAKFTADNLDGITATVDGNNAEIIALGGNTYAVYTDAILATGFGTYHTIVLNNGGEAYQTVTYSVNSFAKTNADLGDALYNYGVAAVNYMATLNA